MKKYFIIFLTFFTLFNGLVWDKLFKGYREYYMTTIDSLEDDRVRLQLRIDELENVPAGNKIIESIQLLLISFSLK